MSSRVRPNRIAALATLAYTLWMENCARHNARLGKPFFPYPLYVRSDPTPRHRPPRGTGGGTRVSCRSRTLTSPLLPLASIA